MTYRQDNQASSSALIDGYMKDLAHALTGLDPQEREEVLTSVQEHIDQALSGESDDVERTREVLSSLGAPDDIAKEALGDRSLEVTSPPLDSSRGDTAAVVVAIGAALLVPVSPVTAFAVALAECIALVAFRRRVSSWTMPKLIALTINIVMLAGTVLVLLFGIAAYTQSSSVINMEPVPPPVSTIP